MSRHGSQESVSRRKKWSVVSCAIERSRKNDMFIDVGTGKLDMLTMAAGALVRERPA